jgi:ribonuclease HI
MPEWVQTFTIDASYDAAGVVGVGIVVQSRISNKGRGPIIARIAEAHLGLSPSVSEMFAVLRALEIARDHRFQRIRIRSDYNWMRRDLRQRFRAQASGKCEIQRRILDLARQFEWIDFGYVPRRKNQIAHALSRRGRFMLSERVAQTTIPTGAEQALGADSP